MVSIPLHGIINPTIIILKNMIIKSIVRDKNMKNIHRAGLCMLIMDEAGAWNSIQSMLVNPKEILTIM
jgi:hypothetical protein